MIYNSKPINQSEIKCQQVSCESFKDGMGTLLKYLTNPATHYIEPRFCQITKSVSYYLKDKTNSLNYAVLMFDPVVACRPQDDGTLYGWQLYLSQWELSDTED